MTIYWKLGLIAAFLAIYGGAVWHTKGVFDQAAQESVLEAQIKEAAKKQSLMEASAKTVETDLLTERQKTAMLTKKLGVSRANKTHSNCKLDADSLSVLEDATSPSHNLPR